MVDAGHDREPRVSVVVPIYNSEKYLSDDGMLHSLLAQTLTEIEIVLVDDGSSDNSLAICREYAYRDDRISVISRANGGEAAARNTGIIAATGTTCWWLTTTIVLNPTRWKFFTTWLCDLKPMSFDAIFARSARAGACHLRARSIRTESSLGASTFAPRYFPPWSA